jgi:hypothetical protein
MDLREIGWGGIGLIDLAHDWDQWRALVKFLSSCTTGGFSRTAQLHGVSKLPFDVCFLFSEFVII